MQGAFIIRISSDAARDITGLGVASTGFELTYYLRNIGAFDITLKHENAGSSATNRFVLPGSSDFVLKPNGAVWAFYDDTLNRWTVMSSSANGTGASGYSGYTGYTGYSGYSAYSGAVANPTILLSAAGGWVSTTNGATIPAQEELATNKQNMLFIDFPDGASTKYAEWTVIVPCNVGLTNMKAQFIWTANSTSTNNVVWQIQASATTDTEALDRTWSSAVTVTDANGASAYTNRTTSQTGTFTPAGYTAGTVTALQVRVFRDPTNGSDTLAATARLIGVVLEVVTQACS